MTARQGELVRERRRQRGLPLPIAEKVLPFRTVAPETVHSVPPTNGQTADNRAQQRMEEAWLCLAEAEQRHASEHKVHALETVYLHKTRTYAVSSGHG
jgi:hypothetical protein